MSVKVDVTFSVELQSIKMTTTSASSGASTTTGPKVSLFAAKSGFVIPKNKLSGSLVPIFKGGKKPGSNDAVNGESTNQVQRKTKWGPDLTQDADVRRGRALAYQTRVDQIVEQLKSGISEPGGDRGSHEPNELEDVNSSSPQIHNKNSELLELEKREAIGEVLKLNPNFKVPSDYKPFLKETAVPIPVKGYPGYNFIGLIFGHGSETQKRLEKETGAKIQVHGTKAHTGEKVEISSSDGNETQVAYEELSVLVTADTFEKVDAAVVLIELLLTSVSGNLLAGDNANVSQNQEASTPFMVSNLVNQGVLPPLTPQQGQFQYQNSWFPTATPQAFVHQPSGLISPQTSSAPNLNNPVRVQSSSFNSSTMPSLFGPRPVQAFSNPYQPRNFPMSTPQPQFNGGMPQPTVPSSVTRPLLPQPLSSGPGGLPPDRLLGPSGISSGWPGAPASVPASLGLGNMGQTTPMVPPPGSRHAVSQLGFPSPAAPPNIAPINHPSTAPTFTSVPIPQVGPSSAPIPIQSSVTPFPNSSATPVFGSAPISSPMMPPSQATLQSGVVGAFPGTTSNFAPLRSPTITNAKVQHSGTGDFTFRPHHLQNPAPHIVPSFSSHHATQNGPLPRSMMQTQTPHAPPFHMDVHNSTPQPGRHLFPRSQVGNQMGQLPFVGNPTGLSLHPRLPAFSNASPVGPPIVQMGSRNFNSTHLPNLTGPIPPRPGNPLQPQQNYPAPIAPRGQSIAQNQQPFISSASPRPASFHGGQQVYDPFSPTSVSVASQRQVGNQGKGRKPENDPEYEDLMASVGVK